MSTATEHAAYFEQMLAERTSGRLDPDSVDAALREMATPGWNWEMFTAAGNAACAAALADILATLPTLAADQLLGVFDAAIASVASAGHLEVGDTDPERHFQDAANLIAVLRGWQPISRYDFHAHQPIIDEANRIKREAREAATRSLIAAHQDEYDLLVAEHEGSLRRS